MTLTTEQITGLTNAKNIIDSILNGIKNDESTSTITATVKSVEPVDTIFEEENSITENIIRLINDCYKESTEKTRKTQVSIVLNQLEELTGLNSIQNLRFSDLSKLSVMDFVSLNKTSSYVVFGLLLFCARHKVKLQKSTDWTSCLKSDTIVVTDAFKTEQEELMREDLETLCKTDFCFIQDFSENDELDEVIKIINRCKNRLSAAMSKIKTAEELK